MGNIKKIYLVLICLSLATNLLAQDITTGLVAYYPFNADANDESGNGNNGTPTGVGFVADRFGNSMSSASFNGTSAEVTINPFTSIDNQSELTISGWFNQNTLNENRTLFGKFLSLDQDVRARTFTDGNLYTYVANNASSAQSWGGFDYDAIGLVEQGTWFHYAMVFDGGGATNADRLKVFINGQEVVLTFSTEDIPTSTPVLGSFTLGDAQSAGGYWDGEIDDVRIYNRTLSNSDISALYYEGSPQITGIYPRSAVEGEEIIVYGLGFDPVLGNNTITIGTANPAVTESALNYLKFNAPAEYGTNPLIVLVGGNSNSGLFEITIQQADKGGLFGSTNPIDNQLDFQFPESGDTGDINGDGIIDLVVGDDNTGKIGWYQNDGTGNLGTPNNIMSGEAVSHLQVFDMDLNGTLDIVYSVSGSPGYVKWLSNDGTANFTGPTEIISGTNYNKVAPVDFDTDGDIDIVTLSSSTLQILENLDGSLGSVQMVPLSPTNIYDFHIGDIDNDKDVDLITINGADFELGWYSNEGSNTISSFNGVSISNISNRVFAADMDLDGDLDIIGTSGQSGSERTFWIENTDSNGTFNTAENPISDFYSGSINADDLNADGQIDIFPDDNTQLGWYQNIAGKFYSAEINNNNTAQYLLSADLDDDGILELIALGEDMGWYGFRETPEIQSFTPQSGPPGTSVAITHNYFSSNVADLRVFIDDVEAEVVSANSSEITITSPVGADLGPIRVVDVGKNLGATSSMYFSPTLATPYDFSKLNFDTQLDLTITNIDPGNFETADFNADGLNDLLLSSSISTTARDLVVLSNNSGVGAVSFSEEIDLSPGNTTLYHSTGDIDNDGWIDAISNGTTTAELTIHKNLITTKGDPINLQPKTVSLSISNPRDNKMIDLNNDGYLDIIFSTISQNIHILKNDQTVNYDFQTVNLDEFDLGLTDPFDVTEIADLNNDGLTDLLVIKQDSPWKLSIFQSEGYDAYMGFKAPIEFEAGFMPRDIDVADLNNDGMLDIVVGDHDSETYFIYENVHTSGDLTTGSFLNITLPSSTGAENKYIDLADFNGDGKIDIISAEYKTGPALSNIRIFENTHGTDETLDISKFIAHDKELNFSFQPRSIEVTDMDNDGNFDILLSSLSNDNVLAILRNSSSALAPDLSLTYVSPEAASSDQTVDIFGYGFDSNPVNNTVTFGGVNAVVNSASSTKVNVTMPSGVTGLVDLEVTTGGNSVTYYKEFMAILPDQDLFYQKQPSLEVAINGPIDQEVIDLDNDGDQDIIMVNSGENLFKYINNGDETFSTSQLLMTNVNAIAVGDPDHDGDADIIVGSDDSNNLFWLENDGTANFDQSNTIFSIPFEIKKIVVGDFDKDGYQDIACAYRNSAQIAWYSNSDGVGTFGVENVVTTTLFQPHYLSVADIDVDGDLDLIATADGTFAVAWYENDGTGGFTETVIDNTGQYPISAMAGDMDGDNDNDIVVSFNQDQTLAWFENTDGNGAFGSSVSIADTLSNITESRLVDLDGDGDLDIAVGSRYAVYYENDGTAAFTPTFLDFFATTWSTSDFFDVDGDGRLDLTVTAANEENVTWYKSSESFSISGVNAPALVGGTTTIDGINFGTSTGNIAVMMGDMPLWPDLSTSTEITIDKTPNNNDRRVSVLRKDLNQLKEHISPITFQYSTIQNLSSDNFLTPQKITGLDSPFQLRLADLDGDSKLDLIHYSINTNSFLIHRNQGNDGDPISSSTFSTPVSLNIGEGIFSYDIGDMDNDGKLDLIVAVSQAIKVFRNTNSPGSISGSSFIEEVDATYEFGWQSTTEIRIEDYDLDGRNDIVTSYSGIANGPLQIYKNTGAEGSITFGRRQSKTNTFDGIYSFELADFNGDGYKDIAGVKISNGLVTVYENNGFPHERIFEENTAEYFTGGNPSQIEIGDLDGDGKQDFAILDTQNGQLFIYKNNSSGGSITNSSFTEVGLINTSANEFELFDINGDTKLDIVTVFGISSDFELYQNNSSPGDFQISSFDGPVLIDVGVDTNQSINVADVNGDGLGDIVTLSNSSEVALYQYTIASSGSDADILTYSFPEETGPATINAISKTVEIEVTFGTDVTDLVATFTLSTGATAQVGGVTQESEVTGNDFSAPVTYVITAEDQLTTENWTITVSVADAGSETDFITFTFPEAMASGTINTTDHRIDIEVIQSADLTNLVAEFELSTGASADIGGTTQTSGTTANDFSSSPVTYTVTAEDGTTTQDWEVHVTQATEFSTATDFISYEFQGINTSATINDTDHTITAGVPDGADVTNLIAVFQLSAGASANVGGTSQISGTTVNDFSSSVTYTVTAEDGTTTQDWTVTIDISTDSEKPLISFVNNPPLTLDLETETVTLSVTATDNIGVTEVKLYHTGIRNFNNNEWTSVTASNPSTDNYQSTLNTSMMDELGLVFIFTASDAQGNTGSTDTLFIRKSSGTNSLADIPDAKLGSGGKAGDWRMFSIPYELDDPNIATIFESVLGTYNKEIWRLVRYNASTDDFAEYKSGLSNIEIGKGYWFNTTSNQKSAIVMGTAKVASVSPSQLTITIPLDNGWTQIGNPYPFSINWNDVLTFNSSSAGGLKVFTGGTSLQDATTLGAFDGAYVFSDGTDVEVPFTTSPKSRSRVKEISNSIDMEDWEVRISIESGEFSNHIGKIGMSPDANEEKDHLDAMRVPRFVKYTDLTFSHPEFWYPWFSGDVVPRQDTYTWEFEASNNTDIPVMLKWDNSYFGDNEYQLYLEDLENGKLVSLRENDFYAYQTDSLRKFKIHYGTSDQLFKDLPLTVSLGTPYPNPFSSSTLIPFTLPDKMGTFEVTFEIYDVLGNRIDVITDKSYPPGLHSVEWKGMTTKGRQVENGLYIVLMKIRDSDSHYTLSQKILKR